MSKCQALVGMSPAGLAVRITLPFSDLSGTVRAWALKADKLLCYEHVGEKTSKPHCHLLLLGVACNKERLKQVAKESGLAGGGNEFWSFKTAKQEAERYIVYMSKGKFDAVYNKGYEPDYLQMCKDAWEKGEAEPSREEKLFRDFEERVIWPFVREHIVDVPASQWPSWTDGTTIVKNAELVQHLARSWAFGHHKRIWSVRIATDAKMVFLTYCMRYDIEIPKDIKSW